MTEFRKELRDFYLKEVPQGLNQYRKDVGRVVFKDIPREIRTTGSSIREGLGETGQDYKRFLTDKERRRSNFRDVGSELRNIFRRENRTDNSYNTGGRINMNSSFRPRQAPMQRQAQRLADQGRYGDSMMVHMNPTEVDVLNQMSPGGLTRNPQTGQPEAFAFLAPLIASMAAKGALGAKLATVATLGNTISPLAAGALASGVTTTAQTGSLEEGIKSGLMSGLVGKIGGDLMKGMTGGTEQIAQSGSDAVSNMVVSPPGGSLADVAGSGASIQSGADFVPQITPDVATSLPAGATFSTGGINPFMTATSSAQDLAAEQAASGFGGLGSGLGDTISNMNMADIGVPMVQGAIAEDAIAMYDGGGAPQEEEEDDFYQEVRPGDRGLQFPEFGYDAGSGGEFDYFSNPFEAIPVAKTGGLLRGFEEGGKVDEPIKLGGIRGFNQTSAPSFDFSGSNVYGPAPVNQADFNLSNTPVDYSQANVASQVPVKSPFANMGMFNFGGPREYGPTDAEMFSYLTGRGGMPSNLPSGVGTVETPDFSSRVPGRFPRASYEDLAMESMRKEEIPMSDRTYFQQQGSMRIPMESDKRYFQQQGSQMPSDRYQTKSIREAFGDRLVSQYSRPETGGIGGRNPNLPPQVIPGLDEAMEMSRLNVSPTEMMPGMQGGDFQIGNDANINVNPFMGDTMYSRPFDNGMNAVNPPMTATGDIGMRPRPDLMNPNFSTFGF